jgi:hypothetical protein
LRGSDPVVSQRSTPRMVRSRHCCGSPTLGAAGVSGIKRQSTAEICYGPDMQPFTVEQAVAARAFLGWTQRELSEASGLSFETIRDFEHDEFSATTKSVDAIRTAFHDAGVEFQRHGKRVGITIVMPWQTM